MLSTMIDTMVHISFLLCIGMIIVIARKCRRSNMRTAFLLVLGIMTLWSIATLLEVDLRIFTGFIYMQIIYICYIGICLLPVAILNLGKVILHPDWQLRRMHTVFLVIPVISIVMVFTNPLHNLFFVNFSLHSSEAVYGAYYYFHSLYSYSCIAVGIVLLLIASIRNAGLFSIQSMLVISGIIITLVPNVLFSFGVGDLTFSVSAAAFTMSILCFAIAFLKFRFITSLPITLRQVVDLISDGYLLVDGQQGISAYNKAFTHMFPKPVNIALGSSLRTFIEQYFLDISYDHFMELQADAVTQQGTVSTETRLLGGLIVGVEITPVLQRYTYNGSIILLKDITQSKLFIEATKAESRYKSEFLSSMSHEIRTPMNAIIGMVNIGKAATEIERKNYCLMRIDDASKHLLGVINNVLDISKIEAGKFDLSQVVFDFGKTIQRVTDVIQFRADEKKQALAVHIDNAIPMMLVGDDQRLAQVITNLIGNAIKFTPEHGSIGIHTQLLGEENEVCTIQFKIIDTGIGISTEQQARLFQSFTQAESDTSRKFGGTGLGLSISKKIVEMMGGRIWVESEQGKGSTFAFTVQLNRNKESAHGVSELNADETDKNIAALFAGRHILIAEDVEINREIVIALLEPIQLKIDCAENGEEVVRMFRESPEKYEMIFMDVQMPIMGGYEATRAIRALDIPQAKTIPIIAMTANVFREDIEKCLEAGMNGHIGKPLNLDDVHMQLRRYLVQQKPLA